MELIKSSDLPPVERVSLEEYKSLLALIDEGSETKIHKFLEARPYVWRTFLGKYRTGHHDHIVISKREIAPHVPNVRRGQIPDFILGGKNSDGWTWFVIELKSPNQSLFARTGPLRFSAVANAGILQLIAYRAFCEEYQGAIRDVHQLREFNTPTAILLLDREVTYERDEERRRLKRHWNKAAPFAEVRTYDSLLSSIYAELALVGKVAGTPVSDPEDREIELVSDVRSEIAAVQKRFSDELYRLD